jgi:hypothetical protein
MKANSAASRLGISVVASMLLNIALLISAAAYNPQKSPSIISKVADALTTPPGTIAGWIFKPSHSAKAIAEALVCSLFFYTLVIWGILELFARIINRNENRRDVSLHLK